MAVEISEDMRDVLLCVFEDRSKLLEALAPACDLSELDGAIDRLSDSIQYDIPMIPEPLDGLQKDCLRWAIENTDYLNPFADYQPELLSYYRKVIRDLAEILEPLGVEISRMPAGEAGITHYPSMSELERERAREELRRKFGLK